MGAESVDTKGVVVGMEGHVSSTHHVGLTHPRCTCRGAVNSACRCSKLYVDLPMTYWSRLPTTLMTNPMMTAPKR